MITIQTISQQLVLNSVFHLYWKDSKGIYLGCNPARANAYNLNPEEIIGKSDSDFMSQELSQQIESNELSVLTTKTPLTVEEPFINSQKKALLFLVHHFPLVNESGQTIGTYSLASDITNQKRDKKNLDTENEQIKATLNSILTNLPSHIYWKDLNSVFLGCNDAQAQSAGYRNRHEIIGKSDYEMPWKADADLIRKSDLKVIETQQTLTFEEASQTANRDEISIFLSKKAPLYDKTCKVIGILGISLDITELKKMEENLRKANFAAETANFLMTEFISNMGHDLATPITDVGSVAQMLNFHSDEYPELKEFLELLSARAEACETVRQSILNATSISNIEVKPGIFSIAEDLLTLEKELRPTIGSKKLKLIIHPSKPLKENLIETDQPKFHGIMYNLLANAINFTEEGQITISVYKENDHFIIKVSDTGIGIPADQYEYIFQQYTKLSRSNKYGATFKGVGAGLYLARIRANILNATIAVESEVGKGSTFTLSIPAHPVKRVIK